MSTYLYVYVTKKKYAIEQGMKGERGDSGRPGVHVSFM